MPSSSYRRKLRNHTEEYIMPIVCAPLNLPIHRVPVIQPSTIQSCNTKFDEMVDEMYQALDVLIDLTDFSDVKTRCEQLTTTIAPYAEYFTILDRIEAHINTIARHTLEPIDISVINEKIQLIRVDMRDLPPICPENDVMASRIAGLITFINKTINMDTFAYSLKHTLDMIQPSIQSFTKSDERLEEIYRVIEEILDNIKNEKPTNVIQWRVRYVKRLVNALVTGNQELTWAI